MLNWKWSLVVAGLSAGMALGQSESVYAPPAPVAEGQGTNQGGINFELNVGYLTDYVYRGVDYSEVVDEQSRRGGGEDHLNMHVDAELKFDLGPRMPHPFIGVAANVYDSDPESRFQLFRPRIGADLTLQPVTFTVGHQNYIYPQREQFESAEVYGKIQLDDSRLWGRERPVLSPYLLVAYDYDLNDGLYAEVGVSHDIIIENYSLTITPVARLAYTRSWEQQFAFSAGDGAGDGTGFQHLDVGLELRYRLNSLLNMPRRWGEWFLTGQVYYTEHLSDRTVGHTETWGGIGIGLLY